MSFEYLTIEQAEARAGRRLDRRRKYFMYDVDADGAGEEVCIEERGLAPCSGCYETGDYGDVYCGEWDDNRRMSVGIGCSECGWTGVRRLSFPRPVRFEFPEVE